jgi:transcriptional regulator with XRE-family HTH domain
MNAKISNTDIAIGAYLDARMKDKHLTQVDIAKAIGRKAQSYVSDRLTGKKSFLISELDIIAPMVGLPDSLALIAASGGRRRVE